MNKVEAYYTFSCLPDGDLQSSFDDDQPFICTPHIQSEAAVIRLHASSINIFSSIPFRNLNLSSGTTIGWLCHKIRAVGNERESQYKQPNGNNKQAESAVGVYLKIRFRTTGAASHEH